MCLAILEPKNLCPMLKFEPLMILFLSKCESFVLFELTLHF